MALASVRGLRFTYPGAASPALDGVSLTVERGERIALLGPSGCGKSTLLRSLAGLVPHFHGGRFEGSVEVAGRDTRRARPADLAGAVGSLFQEPDEQVVFGSVEREVAFGLENVGTTPAEILPRARTALVRAGVGHLAAARTHGISGGELQRVCLASVLALEPQLLLLDEPASQLDEDANRLLADALGTGAAAVISEQRPAHLLELVDRVVLLERGRVLLDTPVARARAWLAQHRPAYLERPLRPEAREPQEVVCRVEGAAFAYSPGAPVLVDEQLTLRRGEVVALVGPNGSGKTTLAKVAAGLLQPAAGSVLRHGRASYLLQDPGRYLVRERVDDEVALGARGDRERARRALAEVGLSGYEARHPRDLSSGERECVALAAVLVTEPDLLVLDEPTRGVDPERKLELIRLLRGGASARATLVVTHDASFAAAVADRTIRRGRAAPEALVA